MDFKPGGAGTLGGGLALIPGGGAEMGLLTPGGGGGALATISCKKRKDKA